MYNLEALKNKLDQLNGKKTDKDGGKKFTYFKPQLGEIDIRFLPYKDSNDQPFQEIQYYDCKELSERRIIAPAQFGLPDPIRDFLNDLRKDRSNQAWKVIKALSPRTRYYSAILVRGQEDKAVQVWEFSQTVCKDIYSILVHQDYREEDMMDPLSGFDFTLTASEVPGKTFNGYAVKELKIVPRRKASKLMSKQADIDKLLASVPNFEEYFKVQCLSPEKLQEMVDAYIAGPSEESSSEVGKDTKSTGSIDSAMDDLDEKFKDL